MGAQIDSAALLFDNKSEQNIVISLSLFFAAQTSLPEETKKCANHTREALLHGIKRTPLNFAYSLGHLLALLRSELN